MLLHYPITTRGCNLAYTFLPGNRTGDFAFNFENRTLWMSCSMFNIVHFLN